MFKRYVQRRLEKYVKKYFAKHKPKLIVVVGSVGKTTTKTAIATVLSTKFRVAMEPENHNTELSVPLGVLGIQYPPKSLLHKVGTWRKIFAAARKRIKWETGTDVIIQELGTEKPGEIAHFGEYLHPNIAVVTAIAPEHMENFPNGLTDVAREELSVAEYSDLVIINHDDVDGRYANYVNNNNVTTYGLSGGEYRFATDDKNPLDGYDVKFFAPEFGGASVENPVLASEDKAIRAKVNLAGEHSLHAAVAAATVGAKLGMTSDEIVQGLGEIRPVAGRMNLLRGVRDSMIIDDTYNSSPSASIAALLTLYEIPTNQRIAILGSMNELGDFSAEAHAQVGAQCDPNFLDWVITIGEESARYLAPVAKKNGCQVATFPDPIAAGSFANKVLQSGGVVLVKGSQNGIFAEEAVKILLRDADDSSQLVRQSGEWMNKTNSFIQSQDYLPQGND